MVQGMIQFRVAGASVQVATGRLVQLPEQDRFVTVVDQR